MRGYSKAKKAKTTNDLEDLLSNAPKRAWKYDPESAADRVCLQFIYRDSHDHDTVAPILISTARYTLQVDINSTSCDWVGKVELECDGESEPIYDGLRKLSNTPSKKIKGGSNTLIQFSLPQGENQTASGMVKFGFQPDASSYKHSFRPFRFCVTLQPINNSNNNNNNNHVREHKICARSPLFLSCTKKNKTTKVCRRATEMLEREARGRPQAMLKPAATAPRRSLATSSSCSSSSKSSTPSETEGRRLRNKRPVVYREDMSEEEDEDSSDDFRYVDIESYSDECDDSSSIDETSTSSTTSEPNLVDPSSDEEYARKEKRYRNMKQQSYPPHLPMAVVPDIDFGFQAAVDGEDDLCVVPDPAPIFAPPPPPPQNERNTRLPHSCYAELELECNTSQANTISGVTYHESVSPSHHSLYNRWASQYAHALATPCDQLEIDHSAVDLIDYSAIFTSLLNSALQQQKPQLQQRQQHQHHQPQLQHFTSPFSSYCANHLVDDAVVPSAAAESEPEDHSTWEEEALEKNPHGYSRIHYHNSSNNFINNNFSFIQQSFSTC